MTTATTTTMTTATTTHAPDHDAATKTQRAISDSAATSIRIVANLPCGADPYAPPKQRLDLYLPQGTGFGMLCFVHGGGLMMGDKSLVRRLGVTCARAGIGVAALNHRLSPAVAHPAHITDVAAGVDWVVHNIARYGGDPARVAIAGHSSGAYLAALLLADTRYLGARSDTAKRVRAVIPISGFFHVERLAPERPKHVWGSDPAAWPDTSPATHVAAPQPPTLLLYADGDDAARRQESLDYGARLTALGGTVVVREIAGRDHRSIFTRMTAPDDPTLAAVLHFLRQHL